ncbi:hypothetical protein BDZ89DRAFT_241784 [Hymenopellis radicata]|nr:hypothetical protein BDZ89DRAFT_241784 [Hymenopellis radicata]
MLHCSTTLSDASITHLMSQAGPLKYLPVLQDPNVTDSLLDEHLAQQDPFQAAMGLVYLSRLTHYRHLKDHRPK